MNYPYRVLAPGEAGERLSVVEGFNRETPYVLHVGSNALRKNRPALLRIMALLNAQWNGKLVLAGEPLSADLKGTRNWFRGTRENCRSPETDQRGPGSTL
jgi:hypothetical protein